MSKIDELISEARKSVNEATEDTRPGAESYLKALEDAKESGVGLSQEEVNGIAKKESDKAAQEWRDALGMELSEVQSIMESLNDEELQGLLPESGEGEGEGEQEGEGESMSERIKAALAERDSAIESERERINTLSQSLYSERVENGLKNALRDKGLKDGRFDLARKLSGESDFVKTLMDGKELESDAFSKAAESLYEASPEWFSDGSESQGDNGQQVGDTGLKLKPEAAAGIPPTPNGNGQSTGMTHEQRLEQSASPFRR